MMRGSRWLLGGTLAALCVAWVPACNGPPPALAPLHGHVLYRGIPVPRGIIVFTPDASRGTSGSCARADIQGDGSYELRTAQAVGVQAGWYRVTVVSVEESPAPLAPGSFALPRSLVPAKYRDPELSGLVCEVKAGQTNMVNFNLD